MVQIAFLSLFLPHMPGIGVTQNGATRWFKIPGLPPIQPAELVKFARQRGCSYIQLTTSRPDAHGFYSAIGYNGDVVRAFRKLLAVNGP